MVAVGMGVAAAAVAVVATQGAAEAVGGRAELFRFEDARIAESSGLAASARHDGVVYTHNDSDDGPRVYAVGGDGRTRAVLTLRGARARDWEGMAPGRDAEGRPVLWIGDIGDNGDGWWEEIWVYRVREPKQLRTADVPWTKYRLRYEDGARNAEALLVDPRTQRLYVVSKEPGEGAVYAAPTRLRTDRVNVLERVAAAPSGVTDGAFLADGSGAVLRGYVSAGRYDRRWRRVADVSLPLLFQGESLAAVPGEGAILVGSEGRHSAVWKVALSGGGATSAPSSKQPASKQPASTGPDPNEPATKTPSDGDDGSPVAGAALVTAAAAGAFLVWRRRRRS